MFSDPLRQFVSWLLSLIALLSGAYLLYRPALGAGFMFDDAPNLEDLARVSDIDSALQFVFSGEAGPLGRPLALASFLLNAPAWPSEPASFLFTNILIHLLNGLLLLWFSLRLGNLLPELSERNVKWFALSVTALWLLNPLLASTSLFTIQRMTSLSATFMLSGSIIYCVGRVRLATQPITAIIIMSLGIGLGTLLAVFTKENGVLLPLYILILEVILIRPCLKKPPILFQVWLGLFLVLPVLLFILYIIITWPGIMSGYATKPWTVSDRLFTEARVLWDYLYQLLLPNGFGIGPFHDGYTVSRGLLTPPSTLLAMVGWISCIWLAWSLRYHAPIFSLGVLWFLAGHSMESSVFSLELYFEHRNYLPAVGPLLIVAYYAWTISPKFRKAALASLSAYIALISIVLWQVTTLWSEPVLAAKIWYKNNLNSPRAAQLLAQQYTTQGDFNNARHIIASAWQLNPHDASLALQIVQLSCQLDSVEQYRDIIAQVQVSLPNSDLSFASLDALNKLTNMYTNNECSNIKPDDIHKFTDALMGNPRFQASGHAMYHLHHIKARLYEYDKLLNSTLTHLEAAFAARPTLVMAMLTASVFASAGLYQQADIFLNHALTKAPSNPVLKKQWLNQIIPLQNEIAAKAR